MAKKKSKDRSRDVFSEIQTIQSLYERILDKTYSSLGISNEQFNVLDILASSETGLALNQIQLLYRIRRVIQRALSINYDQKNYWLKKAIRPTSAGFLSQLQLKDWRQEVRR